jgi:hypothetical protein
LPVCLLLLVCSLLFPCLVFVASEAGRTPSLVSSDRPFTQQAGCFLV